jgi:predicted dehydrogenase
LPFKIGNSPRWFKEFVLMSEGQKRQLRHAVIGAAASVFNMHREALQLPEVNLVAIADINVEAGQQRAQELNCAFYADYRRLLEVEHPDVVTIMTPHPLHAPIAIDALRAGSHVLVEKPIAAQVAEADAMIEAANKAQRLLGVIFQQRYRPEVRAARRLIQEGRLGVIQHVEMAVSWTRTAIYYKEGAWRGTWKGEGGGVLMNQAPHNLDLLCHLIGSPSRVFAWTRNLLHPIETEDTVQAMLEWPGGALGSLHISTAETGIPEALKIVGTGGNLEIRRKQLIFNQLETDLKEFVDTYPKPFAAPKAQQVPVELEEIEGNHATVYRHFYDALLRHGTFTSAGAEGRMSLELANSLIYASYTHSEVALPLDRQKYADLLASLQQQATRK